MQFTLIYLIWGSASPAGQYKMAYNVRGQLVSPGLGFLPRLSVCHSGIEDGLGMGILNPLPKLAVATKDSRTGEDLGPSLPVDLIDLC